MGWALEREMATHSSVLAWRIPGTGEPGGLPSVESHRVGQDWRDWAAAAAAWAGHSARNAMKILVSWSSYLKNTGMLLVGTFLMQFGLLYKPIFLSYIFLIIDIVYENSHLFTA